MPKVLFTQEKLKLGLSNHDIIRILRNEQDFKGWFMSDEKLPIEGCFILNLDAFTDPGTHLVAEYNNEYSFGVPPPKCLEKQIDWNNVRQHQNIKSSLCGLYARLNIQCSRQIQIVKSISGTLSSNTAQKPI